jgi:hypothetical protein
MPNIKADIKETEWKVVNWVSLFKDRAEWQYIFNAAITSIWTNGCFFLSADSP